MIQNLAKDLKNIQQKHRAQNQQLEELYIQFYQINNKKEMLKNSFIPTENQLERVRPEVIQYICSFLDFKAFLNFRLVDQQANKLITQICPQKQELLRQQVKTLEANLEEAITADAAQLASAEIQQLMDQLIEAHQQYNRLKNLHIQGLKTLACPPQLVEQVCYFVTILLGQDVNEKKSKWNQSQKILNNHFLEIFNDMDLMSITEEQLTKVAPIDQITLEEMRSVSFTAAILYQNIKAIVDVRRSKLYITNFKIKEIKKQIAKKHSQIDYIQKVFMK